MFILLVKSILIVKFSFWEMYYNKYIEGEIVFNVDNDIGTTDK
jgi:hypothetical protein